MNTLAEKFRLKRKELRLSQQTLAEGICEQSQISKIERGHFIPSADLLFKLSQRLEVPLDYFFNEQIEIKSNLSNFKQLSARLLDDRNYDNLEYIYRIEIERSTFLTLEDRTYLEWIKAIIDFYQYDSKCEAISSLENILLKVSNKTLVKATRISNFLTKFHKISLYRNSSTILALIKNNKNENQGT
ncbi:transcriptional activator [Streptococcus pneumoniae]|nr:transcriptional activator [Streptococcus pneumoniae]